MSDRQDEPPKQIPQSIEPNNDFGNFLTHNENPFSFQNRSNHSSSSDDGNEINPVHQSTHQQNQQTSKDHAQKLPIPAQQPKDEHTTKIQNPTVQIQKKLVNVESIQPQHAIQVKDIITQSKQYNQTGFFKEQKSVKINEIPEIKQLQYEKQMDKDLMDLKKSINNKTKHKNIDLHKNQTQKNKLNKTVFHSKTSFDEEDSPEVRAMEVKMLQKMAQEKKKQNYQLLKQWDKRRAESLALHRNLIEILQNQVDKRIKSSIENLQIYITFFKEKSQQEEKYVNQPIINTRYALQNNSLSKNVYINCSVILNALSDENMERCKKINDLIMLIKNDIIRDLLDAHLNQSQRQLLRIREKISTLKSSLRKYNAETQQKTNQLAIFFNENSVNLNVAIDKDFYRTQLSFLRKAAQQTHVQKKLGQYCLEYYHTAINQQIKRSKVIRQAMLTYSRGLKQSYNIDIDPAQIEQLSKAEENKLIEEFYCLEQIFDERIMGMLKLMQQVNEKDQITIDHFTKYVNAFEFESFNCRIILLKQFNVRHLFSSKTHKKEQQSCYMVITVDNYIHLFFSPEKIEHYGKPDVTLKVGQKNLEFKVVKNNGLDIVLKEQRRTSMISYFWETKNDKVYQLQFPKKDSRQQFLDYVNKLIG